MFVCSYTKLTFLTATAAAAGRGLRSVGPSATRLLQFNILGQHVPSYDITSIHQSTAQHLQLPFEWPFEYPYSYADIDLAWDIIC